MEGKVTEKTDTGTPDPAADVLVKRAYESPRIAMLGRLRDLTQGSRTAGTDGGSSRARN